MSPLYEKLCRIDNSEVFEDLQQIWIQVVLGYPSHDLKSSCRLFDTDWFTIFGNITNITSFNKNNLRFHLYNKNKLII